jgi:hypothetical protein
MTQLNKFDTAVTRIEALEGKVDGEFLIDRIAALETYADVARAGINLNAQNIIDSRAEVGGLISTNIQDIADNAADILANDQDIADLEALSAAQGANWVAGDYAAGTVVILTESGADYPGDVGAYIALIDTSSKPTPVDASWKRLGTGPSIDRAWTNGLTLGANFDGGSAPSVQLSTYKLIGNLCFCTIDIGGTLTLTADATNTSFTLTLPAEPADFTGTGPISGSGVVWDTGASVYTPLTAFTNNGVTCHVNFTSGFSGDAARIQTNLWFNVRETV